MMKGANKKKTTCANMGILRGDGLFERRDQKGKATKIRIETATGFRTKGTEVPERSMFYNVDRACIFSKVPLL